MTNTLTESNLSPAERYIVNRLRTDQPLTASAIDSGAKAAGTSARACQRARPKLLELGVIAKEAGHFHLVEQTEPEPADQPAQREVTPEPAPTAISPTIPEHELSYVLSNCLRQSVDSSSFTGGDQRLYADGGTVHIVLSFPLASRFAALVQTELEQLSWRLDRRVSLVQGDDLPELPFELAAVLGDAHRAMTRPDGQYDVDLVEVPGGVAVTLVYALASRFRAELSKRVEPLGLELATTTTYERSAA